MELQLTAFPLDSEFFFCLWKWTDMYSSHRPGSPEQPGGGDFKLSSAVVIDNGLGWVFFRFLVKIYPLTSAPRCGVMTSASWMVPPLRHIPAVCPTLALTRECRLLLQPTRLPSAHTSHRSQKKKKKATTINSWSVLCSGAFTHSCRRQRF